MSETYSDCPSRPQLGYLASASFYTDFFSRTPPFSFRRQMTSLLELHPRQEDNLRTGLNDDGKVPATPAQETPGPPPNGQPSALDYRFGSVAREWKWELSCCLLSLTALLLIVGTLQVFNGRPLPELPIRISVNSILAIYVVALKASATFTVASCIGQLQWTWFSSARSLTDVVRIDAATRGPLGGLRWLWEHNLRQPLLALGVSVAIAAVAVDPFAQQLIGHFDCSVSIANETAALPRSSYYKGQELVTGGRDLGPDSDAAGIAGVFGSPWEIRSDGCVTGNCTFTGEYGTVGWCSRCDDMSDAVEIRHQCHADSSENDTAPVPGPCLPSVMDWAANRPAGAGWERIVTSLRILGPTPSLLSTLFEYGLHEVETRTNRLALMYFDEESLRRPFYFLLGKTTFSERRLHPTRLIPWSIDCDAAGSQNNWKCRGYGAARCLLYPCVRKFRTASIRAGQLLEIEDRRDWSGVWDQQDWSSRNDSWILDGSVPGFGWIDLECASSEQRSLIRQQGYQIEPAGRWLTYNFTGSKEAISWLGGKSESPDSLLRSLHIRGCLYVFDYPLLDRALESVAYGFFSGSVNASLLLGRKGVTSLSGSQSISRLYNSGAVDFDRLQSVFRNVSDSMTALARMSNVPGFSDPVVGLVHHYATCVRIDWAWIALPAMLVVCTAVLLGATVASAVRGRQPIWKSSPLALVFHGPGLGSIESRMELLGSWGAGLSTVREMEKASEAVSVKLDRAGGLSPLARGGEPRATEQRSGL